jgi:hypothetical protein
MLASPPTLHDLSKNADNHPAIVLTFAAAQHAPRERTSDPAQGEATPARDTPSLAA